MGGHPTHWIRKINPKFWKEPYKSLKQYLWDTKYHWGEWLAADSDGKSNFKMVTGLLKRIFFSEPEVATAYFAYSSRLFAEIAQELGNSADVEYYSNLSKQITTAYQSVFLSQITGAGAPQARYIRPLALGLVPSQDIEKMRGFLNQTVIAGDYHVGTGFLSTPFLLEELCKGGYYDTAYNTLLQTTAPSWLYAVKQGANTIWESWYGKRPDGSLQLSLNHYSYGAAVGWLFKVMTGIKWDLNSPGYGHFYFSPHPGGDIDFANAEFNSPFGWIRSKWTKKAHDGMYIYEFTIPPNTTATVILPILKVCSLHFQGMEIKESEIIHNLKKNAKEILFDLGSGIYTFETMHQ
jgi:alpha-L-rhamnosidase